MVLLNEFPLVKVKVVSSLGEAAGAQVLQQERTRMPERSVPVDKGERLWKLNQISRKEQDC